MTTKDQPQSGEWTPQPDVARTAVAFWEKYAIGSKICSSCLKCGQQTQPADRAIQHAELPDIFICKTCSVPTPPAREDERTAFEAHWYNAYHAGRIHARENGTYASQDVQRAWDAWQAARAAQPEYFYHLAGWLAFNNIFHETEEAAKRAGSSFVPVYTRLEAAKSPAPVKDGGGE